MIIGHISDIHWLDTTGARWTDFLNKRLTGGLNLLLGRAKTHTKEAAQCALETLKSAGCDHLIITGDLSNLALTAEFNSVNRVIHRFFDDARLTIVPGNHDFYTYESFRAHRFEKLIYQPGNFDVGMTRRWPFVNIVGDIAIIGLNSARPRPWFVAGGILGSEQLNDLQKILKRSEVSSRFKIIALHHNLFQVVTAPGECFRNLRERKELIEIAQANHVDLIVHGHDHDYVYQKLGDTLVAEAGSCSVCRFKADNRAGKFNRYFIEDRQLIKTETWRYEDGKYTLWKSME